MIVIVSKGKSPVSLVERYFERELILIQQGYGSVAPALAFRLVPSLARGVSKSFLYNEGNQDLATIIGSFTFRRYDSIERH
jgi:hypothetical protein